MPIMPRMKTNVQAMPAPELELIAPRLERSAEVLTPAALDLVAALHRKFNGRRLELLAARAPPQHAPASGALRRYPRISWIVAWKLPDRSIAR